jgi:TM2 domain-containing membrane protein YozV
MKNKKTAILLSLLAGNFGIHRFYLREQKKAFIYLLFCWTLLPFIISIFDSISLIIMDKEAFDNRYNHKFIYNKKTLDLSSVIEKTHELKQLGIITEKEFGEKKIKLLWDAL